MNNKNTMKVVIVSDIGYEKLIAEIYYDDAFIGLIQQEEGKNNLKVEFSNSNTPISLESLQEALQVAKGKLLQQHRDS
ncbi:hypothetical protein DT73_17165 [Mangrovibacter sp. MFB070]|uniref:hypothetical protein n=1 Tax=Mangrovibacter sp. MFB070 TaxID=1224318 RepID=UPI0004DAC396|nr:hypothetical protein [Mangrovibacter sp. MFB070]KEA51445.1 hypothetical protein DT73_17165 [Mangrovibacter sp. MFB070]